MMTNIRKATESDLLSILNLYAQLELDNGQVLSLDKAKLYFQKMQSYPNYRVYVAENEQQQIVGTFALLIMDNLGHLGAFSGVVEDVAVDPSYQGKGIGKQMTHFAMELCKVEKCYKLMLSSNLKRKKAHQFYESLGFKLHGNSYVVEF